MVLITLKIYEKKYDNDILSFVIHIGIIYNVKFGIH